jgi:hypothetical protein
VKCREVHGPYNLLHPVDECSKLSPLES